MGLEWLRTINGINFFEPTQKLAVWQFWPVFVYKSCSFTHITQITDWVRNDILLSFQRKLELSFLAENYTCTTKISHVKLGQPFYDTSKDLIFYACEKFVTPITSTFWSWTQTYPSIKKFLHGLVQKQRSSKNWDVWLFGKCVKNSRKYKK
jgi:hypothetical protein